MTYNLYRNQLDNSRTFRCVGVAGSKVLLVDIKSGDKIAVEGNIFEARYQHVGFEQQSSLSGDAYAFDNEQDEETGTD